MINKDQQNEILALLGVNDNPNAIPKNLLSYAEIGSRMANKCHYTTIIKFCKSNSYDVVKIRMDYVVKHIKLVIDKLIEDNIKLTCRIIEDKMPFDITAQSINNALHANQINLRQLNKDMVKRAVSDCLAKGIITSPAISAKLREKGICVKTQVILKIIREIRKENS